MLHCFSRLFCSLSLNTVFPWESIWSYDVSGKSFHLRELSSFSVFQKRMHREWPVMPGFRSFRCCLAFLQSHLTLPQIALFKMKTELKYNCYLSGFVSHLLKLGISFLLKGEMFF